MDVVGQGKRWRGSRSRTAAVRCRARPETPRAPPPNACAGTMRCCGGCAPPRDHVRRRHPVGRRLGVAAPARTSSPRRSRATAMHGGALPRRSSGSSSSATPREARTARTLECVEERCGAPERRTACAVPRSAPCGPIPRRSRPSRVAARPHVDLTRFFCDARVLPGRRRCARLQGREPHHGGLRRDSWGDLLRELAG